jgi:hypothetical protein
VAEGQRVRFFILLVVLVKEAQNSHMCSRCMYATGIEDRDMMSLPSSSRRQKKNYVPTMQCLDITVLQKKC